MDPTWTRTTSRFPSTAARVVSTTRPSRRSGKLSEALEVVEHARGHLYGFHRLTGTADLALGEAVDMFREAGHDELADRLETELVGRNVIEGRWTFQIVEEYDDNYYATFSGSRRGARRARRRAPAPLRVRDEGGPAHAGAAPPRGSAGQRGGGVCTEPPQQPTHRTHRFLTGSHEFAHG